MYKADKFKIFIAIIILVTFFISFFVFGKPIAKWVAIFGGVAWIVAMIYLNRNKNKLNQ